MNKITSKTVKDIFAEYSFNTSDVLNYDDETKEILDAYDNNLTQAEKIILQIYAETSSQRKTASLLGVSRTAIVKELNKIRNKIFEL